MTHSFKAGDSVKIDIIESGYWKGVKRGRVVKQTSDYRVTVAVQPSGKRVNYSTANIHKV